MHHNKRPCTQIDFRAVYAEGVPATDDAAYPNRCTDVEDHASSTRPQKKLSLDKPTDTYQHIESDDLMVAVPWAAKPPGETYQMLFDLQIGDKDYFTVAEEEFPDAERKPVVIVKTFTGPTSETDIRAIRRIQHDRFVDPQLFFHIHDGYMVSFEFMPLALCEIAGSPLLNDLRMASALGQVSYMLAFVAICTNTTVDCGRPVVS